MSGLRGVRAYEGSGGRSDIVVVLAEKVVKFAMM